MSVIVTEHDISSVHFYYWCILPVPCFCCALELCTGTWWFNTETSHCSLQDEQIEWGKQELTVPDIQQKVKEYNAQINSNLFMNMVSTEKLHQFHAF